MSAAPMDDADEDEDAGGFPSEIQATADGFSMGDDASQKRLSRRSTSSLSSDDEEAVGFGDGDFATARSTSPALVDEEEEESGFLEDAYAAGLEDAGAGAGADDHDPVADAAAEASARELEKTYGAAIGAGLVVAGEIKWGGYAEGEDVGGGEELQYDEPGTNHGRNPP